jgi:hypothetical protein
MPPTGSEPTIPASKQPQTHDLDCAATGIGEELIGTTGVAMSSQPGRQVYVTMLTVRSEPNACLQKRTKHITASNQGTAVDSGEQL